MQITEKLYKKIQKASAIKAKPFKRVFDITAEDIAQDVAWQICKMKAFEEKYDDFIIYQTVKRSVKDNLRVLPRGRYKPNVLMNAEIVDGKCIGYTTVSIHDDAFFSEPRSKERTYKDVELKDLCEVMCKRFGSDTISHIVDTINKEPYEESAKKYGVVPGVIARYRLRAREAVADFINVQFDTHFQMFNPKAKAI